MHAISAGPTTLVREILATVPGAPAAFTRHHVDYCCHGALALVEACDRVGADVDHVIAALQEEAARPDAEPPWVDEFADRTLEEIVRHVCDEVHASARRDLASVREALDASDQDDKVVRALRPLVASLEREILTHLAFEERHVFPYIAAMERTRSIPPALFHSVSAPIATLTGQHEESDALLDELRLVTHGYEVTPGMSSARVQLFERLAAYDRALVRHMHVEGNVLFPRALEYEDSVRPAPTRRTRR